LPRLRISYKAVTLSGKEEITHPNIRISGVHLGIDIGKNTHVASMVRNDRKPVFRTFFFTNTTGGSGSFPQEFDPVPHYLADSISDLKRKRFACWIRFFPNIRVLRCFWEDLKGNTAAIWPIRSPNYSERNITEFSNNMLQEPKSPHCPD